jgi:hypothetical protein
MRKPSAFEAWTASVLVVFVAAGLTLAQESSTNPPTDLKLVGDHWTAWDPPEAGPDAYIIQKGDTLWDLAESWLNDPFLWPQIWDENRYILDSHWIYPGDPLVIPGRPTVVPEEGPETAETVPPEEPVEDTGVGEEETVVEEEMVPAPAPMVLVAAPSDVYCSGYIDPEHEYSSVWVGGSEEPLQLHLAEGNVLYLNQGRNQGVQAGDEFAVVRKTGEIKHPATGQMMGSYIQRVGKVRVMLTQEDTSTGVVEMSCSDVRMSDELIPWATIPIPRRSSMPPFDRYDVTPSDGPSGLIVALPQEIENAAEGHIVQTDLGLASGVKPGDVLTVYRRRQDLPRTQLGQLVVLTVDQTTSSGMVHLSVREMKVGDRVEVVVQ